MKTDVDGRREGRRERLAPTNDGKRGLGGTIDGG